MIISILALIVVLGILIFIHELGHFVVAKLSGVGVEKFSLGFGPRIFWFTRGETEYRLSLLPFGGYVKMMGESPDEEVPEEDKLKSFSHKPISRRAAIVAAGSFMNIVLALVLFPLIFMVGISVPAHLEMPPVVGYVTPDSPAHTVGIKKGDIIESVNGRPVGKWEDLVIAVALEPERDMVFKLRRGTETFDATVIDTDEPMGLYAPMSAIVGEVSGGAPAEEAGLKAGDRILDIDGREIDHWAALRDAIKDSPEERDFLVERGELLYHYHIKPRFDETDEVYRIGILYHQEMTLKRYGFFEAVKNGLNRAASVSVLLFKVVKGLIVGEYSIKALGGPVMIAQVAGQAVQSGLVVLLSLMAFLSLQLGIINLFPIPVLDGGHLMFFAIEYVRGRPVNERIITVAQQIGVAMLIALMLLVTWNDIMRVLGWA
jgi:regulator of sigma E protease